MPKESLLTKLKKGSLNTKLIKWPGTEEDIRIRILNEQDFMEASQATDAIFDATGRRVAAQNVEDYESEKLTQQLFRAIEDPVTAKPLTASITEFRKLLSSEVKAILVDEFRQFQDECNPDPLKMTEEEFDILYNNVKKNSEKTVGNISSIFIARKLLLIMAQELTK